MRASAIALVDSGPTRARMPSSTISKERLHAADLTGLGEQPLDGELQVVDLLEGEVDALGDTSDDQANDGLKVAGERRLELDELSFDRRIHSGSPIVPYPTTASSRMRQAS